MAMNAGLDITVREALQRRRGEWPALAEQAGVSHSWISQFVRGRIPNPGYRTLQKLAGALLPAPAAAPTDQQAA